MSRFPLRSRWLLLAGLALAADPLAAKTVRFSGLNWDVRPKEIGGPGPQNHWSPDNAWVDAAGRLHLRLAARNGVWECPEVFTRKKFGLGRYVFVVEGRIDRLDKNVVLGLFDYPAPGQGPDGTNEIDIEFARWGQAANPIGNYTVFPAVVGEASATKGFRFRLPAGASIQTFVRAPGAVSFESRAVKKKAGGRQLLGKWTFAPAAAERRIPRAPLPVHINLWLFESPAPSDGREVEIVIRSFRFHPG